MNKTALINALADRLDGDRRLAGAAVDGLLEIVVSTVRAGEPVSILGFGVFEQRQRRARTARNPRTGQPVEVTAAAVPAFRPGAGFRNAVNGSSSPLRASSRGRARPVSVAQATAGTPSAVPVAASVAAASVAEPPAPEALAVAEASPMSEDSNAARPAKVGKPTKAAKSAKLAKAGKLAKSAGPVKPAKAGKKAKK